MLDVNHSQYCYPHSVSIDLILCWLSKYLLQFIWLLRFITGKLTTIFNTRLFLISIECCFKLTLAFNTLQGEILTEICNNHFHFLAINCIVMLRHRSVDYKNRGSFCMSTVWPFNHVFYNVVNKKQLFFSYHWSLILLRGNKRTPSINWNNVNKMP